jgi:hypothetical protein
VAYFSLCSHTPPPLTPLQTSTRSELAANGSAVAGPSSHAEDEGLTGSPQEQGEGEVSAAAGAWGTGHQAQQLPEGEEEEAEEEEVRRPLAAVHPSSHAGCGHTLRLSLLPCRSPALKQMMRTTRILRQGRGRGHVAEAQSAAELGDLSLAFSQPCTGSSFFSLQPNAV